MCGRLNLRTTPSQIASLFGVEYCPPFDARYNIAPTQDVLVDRLNDRGEQELQFLRWGLIPFWADDIKIGYKLINARSETAAEKPSFRAALKQRRCLIPVSGFYEWKRDGKTKIPFHIHRDDDQPFALAGLWERWEKGNGAVESFTILTTAANSFMTTIHDRMPVVIPQNEFPVWLDNNVKPHALTPLLNSREWTHFEATQVSTIVNNARHETEDCIHPVE